MKKDAIKFNVADSPVFEFGFSGFTDSQESLPKLTTPPECPGGHGHCWNEAEVLLSYPGFQVFRCSHCNASYRQELPSPRNCRLTPTTGS